MQEVSSRPAWCRCIRTCSSAAIVSDFIRTVRTFIASRKCGCCMVRLQSTYGVAIQARGQSRDCENVAMAESASSCSLDYRMTNDSSE